MEMNNDKIINFYIKNNATIEEVIELRRYLDELEDAANKYYALEAGGVDNWDGYSYAMEELKENEKED
jgi:hypothetical protein